MYQGEINLLYRGVDYDGVCHSPASTVDDGDSQQAFGVDLSGKGTSLGKSFTIAAILGLTGAEDAMALGVQERLQNQRQLHNYLYAGHDAQRLNEGLCRMAGVSQTQGECWSASVVNNITKFTSRLCSQRYCFESFGGLF